MSFGNEAAWRYTMTLYLPLALKPGKGEDPAARRAKRRLLRKGLRELGGSLLAQNGYTIGDSLSIGRAAAFDTLKRGKSVKVGIRASADRWVAVTQSALSPAGELRNVDELILVTFADPKTRDKIQLWRFDARLVADMADKVFAAAGTTGQQWLPLDDTLDTGVHSMVAGNLSKSGTLLAEEALEWVEAIPPAVTVADLVISPSIGETSDQPLKLTIAQAKAGLAAHFGVSVDCIKITIEG